jgi:hypothetical protein
MITEHLHHIAEAYHLTGPEITDVQQLAQTYLDHGKSPASAYEIGIKAIRAMATNRNKHTNWAQDLELKIRQRIEAVILIAAYRIMRKGGSRRDQDSAALAALLALLNGESAASAVESGIKNGLYLMQLNGRYPCAHNQN